MQERIGRRSTAKHCWLVALACILAVSSLGSTNEVARTTDSSGGIVSNTMFGGVTAVGQGCPVSFSQSPSYLNHAGFLHSDTLGPSSGQDLDLDGLLDWVELSGTANDPATPSSTMLGDTDGDGHGDFTEARTGTSPLDAGSQLYVTSVNVSNQGAVVTWLAREGLTYEVLYSPFVGDLASETNILATVTASGGEGDWEEAWPTATNAPVIGQEFYFIRLVDWTKGEKR